MPNFLYSNPSICTNLIFTNYFYWPKYSICTNVVRFVRVFSPFWAAFFSHFRIFQIFLEECKCKSIVCSAWLFELKLISKRIGTFRFGIVRGQMGIFSISICTNFVRIFLNALLRVCYLDLYDFFWTWTLYYVYVISICTNSICTTFLRNALVVQTEGLL